VDWPRVVKQLSQSAGSDVQQVLEAAKAFVAGRGTFGEPFADGGIFEQEEGGN
jgi:hypothetical protein